MTQPPSEAPDKDLPLREDTRLLGRLLGDVLREQAGDAVYARIEAIRQTAIRFRRAGPDLAPAVKAELDALLSGLPIAETLHVVRAFSYFSHLANIAEDVHQNRRRRAHALAGSPPQRGSLADAVERVAAHGTQADALLQWFGQALIAPVLTAHPTEVQRKSILDCRARDRPAARSGANACQLTRDEIEELDERPAAPGPDAVADGDDPAGKAQGEGRDRERPRLLPLHVPRRGAADLRGARGARCGAASRSIGLLAAAVPAAGLVDRRRPRRQPLRRCAEMLDYAIRAQSAVALAHYLDEVHALGGELSLSTRLVEADARAAEPRRRRERRPIRTAPTSRTGRR